MNKTEHNHLAKRATTVFKWADGMRTKCGRIVVPRDGMAFLFNGQPRTGNGTMSVWTDAGFEPMLFDLNHPGNLGHMLAQVREAYGDPNIHVAPDDDWTVWEKPKPHNWRIAGIGETEAEALIAAMEAHNGTS